MKKLREKVNYSSAIKLCIVLYWITLCSFSLIPRPPPFLFFGLCSVYYDTQKRKSAWEQG